MGEGVKEAKLGIDAAVRKDKFETIEREVGRKVRKKKQKEKQQQPRRVRGEESRGGKASEHCTACHWPPGVNNPSQIDLAARPSRAF